MQARRNDGDSRETEGRNELNFTIGNREKSCSLLKSGEAEASKVSLLPPGLIRGLVQTTKQKRHLYVSSPNYIAGSTCYKDSRGKSLPTPLVTAIVRGSANRQKSRIRERVDYIVLKVHFCDFPIFRGA